MWLASEAIQGAALSLECVDDIQCSDSLSASVFSVSDCVSHDILQEDLEDVAGFVVDESADALHSASARESADGGLGDALDVLANNSPMAFLGAYFAESLASFAASDHFTKAGRRAYIATLVPL